jgi:hypothetical protein
MPVTLQISLAPPDVGHVAALLPHQLQAWGGQVDEILCVVDLRAPPGADGPSWTEQGRRLIDLLGSSLKGWPASRVWIVDYGHSAARAVSDAFFGGQPVPAKDFRGGPFYAYFHALLQAAYDVVLHVDSDMLFGGGSAKWLAEAGALLADRPEVVACRPLPGPPTADGTLRDQQASRDRSVATLAYLFDTFTTRVFLVNRRDLAERLAPLAIRRHPPSRQPTRRETILDLSTGVPLLGRARRIRSFDGYELPERLIGESMRQARQYRLDLLGQAPGMWSLHPTMRTQRFYQVLPRVVACVERGDVTEEQRGRYDLHESMLA